MTRSEKLPTMGSSLGGMLTLRLVSQVASLGTVVILTRALGPEEFGRYSFLFIYLSLFTLFNVNGLNDILVREIASRPVGRDSIYRAGLWLKLGAGLIAYVLACTVLGVFEITTLPWALCCIGALTLFFSFSMGSTRMIWDVLYQVDFRMTAASVFNLTAKLIFFGLLGLWVASHAKGLDSGLLGGAGSFLSGAAVAIILLIVSEFTATLLQVGGNWRYKYAMIPRPDWRLIRYLLKEVWPLAVAGGLVMIYTQINVVMIRYFLSERDVGLFAAPKKLVDALLLIPTVFMSGFLPILSKAHKAERDQFHRLVKLCYRVMLAVALPIVAVVTLYSADLINLVSGKAYAGSVPVFAVMIWVSPLWFCGIVFTNTLIAANKQRFLIIVFGVQALLGVALYSIVIPKFGIIGASWATLVTYSIMYFLALIFSDIAFAGRLWFASLPLSLFAAFVAAVVSKALHLSLLLGIVAIPLVFCGILLATRWINHDDWILMRELIRARAGRTTYDN